MTNDEPQPIRRRDGRRYRFLAMACLAVSLAIAGTPVRSAEPTRPPAQSQAMDLDAWTTAKAMGVGINIGNTLENTHIWETGWGNPPITKQHIQLLAGLGFKTVRLPVAWDTYAKDGRIDRKKMERVSEVVDWILAEGMFCVINIHWDGGWIDSGDQKRFPKTYATFSPEAERKFQSYWNQIATHFADRNHLLVFEGLNEETNFSGHGSEKKAFETLARVNQLFIDTVRNSGGNNGRRLLIVTGYQTNIDKTTSADYILPKDKVPHKLLLSVHYYTPWPFVGMTKDESWGKKRDTWGTAADFAEVKEQLDKMQAYSTKNDIPVFIGEFAADTSKDPDSRLRWMKAVDEGALSRKMVPVLWEIGQEISRKPPIDVSPVMGAWLVDQGLVKPEKEAAAASK